jgi:transmembrane sensor
MKSVDTSAADARKVIADEAAQWYVTLHAESCSTADRRAFAEWVARSPECVAAYLRISRTLGAIQSSTLSWPETSVEQIVADAKAEGVVTALPGASAAPSTKSGSRWRAPWIPVVAAAAALIVSLGTWLLLRTPHSFETDVGEQRSVVLEDGSVVTLNTSSRIDVDLRADRRVIRLDRGEALFQVARDPGRPFAVVAGTATVQAVGTEFNVDRRDARTTVTVVEGQVRVRTQPATASVAAPDSNEVARAGTAPEMMLAAAERVVIAGDVLGTPERIANIAPVTAWTQRRLVFERRPLGEVAEEFNRYNRQRIRVLGASLRQQEVTGLFQANDPESFVQFLAGIPDVRIERNASGDYLVHDDSEKSSDSAGGPN